MDECELYEEWRDIPDYEGYYQASSLGRIRSLDHYRKGINGHKQIHRGRILKQSLNSGTGYLLVILCKNGVRRTRDVHRIIAETFLKNDNELPCVDHIDNDKRNNSIDNLRWVTQKENVMYAIEDNLIDLSEKRKILKDPYVKLAKMQALAKRIKRSDGLIFDSISEAARYTGCSKRAIDKVLNGDNKTCFGYTFELME